MRINFDDNWKFKAGDFEPRTNTANWGGAKARGYLKGAASVNFDDTDWRTVDLPHDFVSEQDYCFESDKSDMGDIPEMESIDSRLFAGGCLEGGVAWYRKHFNIDRIDGRVYIHFDGVYRNSTVYVNQYYAGTHASGYSGFYYDITDFVNEGENLIAVRVDASGREGWWYEGGGIYRHTWLEMTDNAHIEEQSLYASAENINIEDKTADIRVSCTVLNKYYEPKQLTVKTEIKSPDGVTAAESEHYIEINEWDKKEIEESFKLNDISIWDLKDTRQYTVKVSVYSDIGECDTKISNFGIRTTHFDADKGFFLNGRHVKIKGVCCHYDHAGVGIGIPDTIHRYRIEKIKEMGANALRLSHYPPSQELLNICDELGVLVFSEVRRMSSAEDDIESLRYMIRSGRNHPSVFLWGIGNEEIFSQHRPETARTTLTMKAEIKKLDPTRPITSAVVCWDGERRYDNAEKYVEVTKNLDVMGFNYCHTAWDDYHERVPSQPVIITEEASNSGTRGCYSTNESSGQYCVLDEDNFTKCQCGAKAVKKDVGETAWKMTAERDYIAGLFIWTGFDYRGEPTPLKYPAVYSQFGAMDYCGFAKDNFYYYKSWWSNEPVLHIVPNIFAGGKVYCYSNLDEAELFADGVSCGRKTIEKNWYLTWENVSGGRLTVKGYKDGKAVMEAEAEYCGEPHSITAVPYFESVKAGDTAIINIRITDKEGKTASSADNRLFFSIEGGKFLGSGNGNPGDHDNEKELDRCAFKGLCQIAVKAYDSDINVKVTADGLNAGECKIKIER